MITGGTGFVGSHLVDSLLNDNNELMIVSKTNSKQKNLSHIQSRITVNYIDIINQYSFKKTKSSLSTISDV